MGDEINLFFSSKDWQNEVEPLEKLPNGTIVVKVPQSKEVERIARRKDVTQAENSLLDTTKAYKLKIDMLQKRIKKVKNEQGKLKHNLVKFNNFVREKQLKASSGLQKRKDEVEEQSRLLFHMEEMKDELIKLETIKLKIQQAVGQKKIFREFLQRVVEDEKSRNRYKDIEELIKGCNYLHDYPVCNWTC